MEEHYVVGRTRFFNLTHFVPENGKRVPPFLRSLYGETSDIDLINNLTIVGIDGTVTQ